MYPKAGNKDYMMLYTLVCKGASIGANSTILLDMAIYESVMAGAGCVVTKDIPVGELLVGNSIKFV